MKHRSLSGNVAVGVFALAFVCVCVAFATPAWLVSDSRLTGAKLEKLGLWVHCFRSYPDPQQADSLTKFYSGCRWVFDPFTAGYEKIRPFLLPPFMVATQFFFTVCFMIVLISCGLIIFFVLCTDPERKHYVRLIQIIGYMLLVGGISGCVGVIIFAVLGNAKGWMPGQDNNFLHWSFGLGVAGSILCLIAASLFFVEASIQNRKRQYFKESQTRFQMETKS